MFMSVSLSTDSVLTKWLNFLRLSDRKPKAEENAVTAYGHVRAIVKYLMMGWEEAGMGGAFYTWKFLYQPEHIKQ